MQKRGIPSNLGYTRLEWIHTRTRTSVKPCYRHYGNGSIGRIWSGRSSRFGMSAAFGGGKSETSAGCFFRLKYRCTCERYLKSLLKLLAVPHQQSSMPA
jgi:hypothetical protein